MRSFLIILFMICFCIAGLAQAADSRVLPHAQDIASLRCENGSVPVPPGHIISWKPPGCTKRDGLVEIHNYLTSGCMVLQIAGVQPMVVEPRGMGLVGIGFYQPSGQFIPCLPPATSDSRGNVTPTVMWTFLTSTTMNITGTAYQVQRDWTITDVMADPRTGLPVKPLNGNIGGLIKPAERLYTCRTQQFDALHPDLWNGPARELPVAQFNGIVCPH